MGITSSRIVSLASLALALACKGKIEIDAAPVNHCPASDCDAVQDDESLNETADRSAPTGEVTRDGESPAEGEGLNAVDAVITGAPTGASNATVLAIDVTSANGLVSYRYKLGIGAATDCANDDGYSAPRPEGDDIVDSLSGLPDGLLRLCVRGVDAAAQAGLATVVEWVKDTTGPGGFSINGPASPQSSPTPSASWGAAADAATYDVGVDDDAGCAAPIQTQSGVMTTIWALQALPGPGVFYVCVTARDLLGNATLAANNGLSFAYGPVPSMNGPPAGRMYGKQGEAVTFPFIASGGTGPYTYSVPVNPGGTATVSGGAFAYTPAATGQESYTVRATDSIGHAVDQTFTLTTDTFRTCVWTGTSSAAWELAGNWIFCSGAAPGAADRVLIDGAVANQPTVTASTTIDAFAAGLPDGGTVTISTATLTLVSTTHTFQSSLVLRGAAAACATCAVNGSGDMRIRNGATLTLQTGLRLRLADDTRLYVGVSGAEAGHLVTQGGATAAEWPVIRTIGTGANNHFRGIFVAGASAANRSSVDIDGLALAKLTGQTYDIFRFSGNFDIQRLDDVSWSYSASSHNMAAIKLENCTDSQSVAVWNSPLALANGQRNTLYSTTARNVEATGASCTAANGFNITVTQASYANRNYGHVFENDPNGIINWTGTTQTCTWNGSQDTNWQNPLNWDNCANGRGGFPDQNDWVIVPAAPLNQPLVSTSAFVQGFAQAGGAGGTVTIAAGRTLVLYSMTQTFGSSVALKGETAGCATCEVETPIDGATIFNGATVTLGNDLSWIFPDWQGTTSTFMIRVGNNATAGHLATVAADANQNYWPRIQNVATTGDQWGGIVVDGAPGNTATLNLDGLKLIKVATGRRAFDLIDEYAIAGFDNVNIDYDGTPTSSYVRINSCVGSTFNDQSWDNIVFTDACSTAYNIKNANADCAGMNTLTLTGSGACYGAAFDDDATNNKLTWN